MSKAIQRIESLLDEHSFVELGALVTSRSTDFNLNDRKAPSDGVVIGHGLIDDNLVFVFSQDASVLNGTIGEMHAKKILSVYDMAVKMGCSGHRSSGLCRCASAGVSGCDGESGSDLPQGCGSFRRGTADYGCVWKLWRRPFRSDFCQRLYFYGEGCEAVPQHAQRHRRQP